MEGLILSPTAMAEMVRDGEKKLIVKSKPFDVAGKEFVLLSSRKAYGTVRLGKQEKLTVKQFERRRGEHRISDEQRQQWWPKDRELWAWPVKVLKRYDPPRATNAPTGPQVVVRSVTVKEHLTEAVPKISSDPLTDSYLKAIAKEIEQTAVAVSVTGAASWKLKQMAALAEPVADALEGERPEVSKLRSTLKRLAHNVWTSPTGARKASAALRALAGGLRDARKVAAKGLGKADPFFKAAGFEVVNTWGYTSSEVRDVTRALEGASKVLTGVGLLTAAGGLVELNPAKVKGTAFVQYDPTADLFIFDAQRSGSANIENVLRALAERLWLQEFGKGDRETWGNGKGQEGFSRAFAGQLLGQRLDSDVAARLQVTVGKLAARWPEAKGIRASRELSPLDRILQEIKYDIGTRRKRKTGVHVKIADPSKWRKVKGTFAQDVVEDAEAQAKKRKELASTIRRMARYVQQGLIAPLGVGDHIRAAKEMRAKHAKRQQGFMRDLGRLAGPRYKVTGRLKDLDSMLGKIAPPDAKNVKYKAASALGDVTGTRIIAGSIGEVYDIIESIKGKGARYGIRIKNIDDKVRNPQGAVKYRSIHLDIVDKDGEVKELQIRTRRQDMAADWSHDQYKPYTREQVRALERHKNRIIDYAARVSDYFYSQDKGEEVGAAPPCPRVVSRYFGCIT